MPLGGISINAFTSRGGLSLATQVQAKAALPDLPRAATYIQRVNQPLTAVPWDPTMPVPAGYELVSFAAVRETETAIARGTLTTSSRALDVSVTPLSPLSAQRREAQRQRAEARAAARKERREQLKRKRAAGASARAARPARVSRPPRRPRRPRKPRAPRRARTPRAARPPRYPRRPGSQNARPKGLCKFSDETGGCWNAGTCGPSPTGGPGTVGHCVFAASEDCNACQQGACKSHGAGLIRKMLAVLPAAWRADPDHEAKAQTAAAAKRARRVRRRLALPPESPFAPAAAAPVVPQVMPPHAPGCPHGTGLCCGLTGFRCAPPGPGCGACSNAQRTAAALMGQF